MKLNYSSIHFYFKFDKPVFADNYPPFVIRSILGKNLRSMCCISRMSKCELCEYNEKCVFASIFETIVNHNNKVLPGAVRVSHPFSITQNSSFNFRNRIIDKIDFTLTIFGDTIKYLPYIYAAFVRAGKDGMFKSRTPFTVQDVQILDKSILIDDETLLTEIKPCSFDSSTFIEKNNRDILIQLISPMRFKIAGQYKSDFTSAEFFGAAFRRMKDLCTMYGEMDNDELYLKNENEIFDKNIRWMDCTHYSSRQKRSMELGGVTGYFKIHGNFSKLELAALEFCRIANIGKNTVFGLGQIDYWEK